MKQFEDLTDYTFYVPDGFYEITISADDLDEAERQAPPNSELIRVNDDPRFQGVFIGKNPAGNQLAKWHKIA